MARVKLAKHQLLRTLVTASVAIFTLALVFGSIMDNIFIFILTGVVTGTNIVVPVWGMYILYGSGIAAILIYLYMSDSSESLDDKQPQASLPRRRYSH